MHQRREIGDRVRRGIDVSSLVAVLLSSFIWSYFSESFASMSAGDRDSVAFQPLELRYVVGRALAMIAFSIPAMVVTRKLLRKFTTTPSVISVGPSSIVAGSGLGAWVGWNFFIAGTFPVVASVAYMSILLAVLLLATPLSLFITMNTTRAQAT